MKKILFLVTLAIIACSSVVFAGSISREIQPNSTTDSPQVCQFSLSKYTGTITNGGNTELFTVGLSCPVEQESYATVVVFIDNQHVASAVVQVKAGETRSSGTYISVGAEYIGKRYNLVVQ